VNVGGIELVCSRCRGRLEDEHECLVCTACESRYPIVAGIADMRVSPDPWINLEDDRRKALRVLDEAAGLDFAGHVRTYWKLTPTTASEQADRFTEHVLAADVRTLEWLERAPVPQGATPVDGVWLDVGCGTAEVAAVAGPDVSVVGVDIAMRWLVVAQKRLEEAGAACHLVCANAEALPFPDGAFANVVALGLIEHCRELDSIAAEARRVLKPAGTVRARTVNRFSMLPEPHVGLWGVGLLPRAWADPYVRWRSSLSYEHHHPWSAGAIRRALRAAGFTRVRVLAGVTLDADLDRAGRLVRLFTPMYELARKTPVLRRFVTGVAPLLDFVGVAP